MNYLLENQYVALFSDGDVITFNKGKFTEKQAIRRCNAIGENGVTCNLYFGFELVKTFIVK